MHALFLKEKSVSLGNDRQIILEEKKEHHCVINKCWIIVEVRQRRRQRKPQLRPNPV